LKTGLLEDFSEQQIASCTSNPNDCGGTGGCNGGTAEVAYASIIAAGGITSEWTYPYVSYTGNNFACQLNSKSAFVANMSSYVTLPSNQVGGFLRVCCEFPAIF
jgi:cathepsin L